MLKENQEAFRETVPEHITNYDTLSYNVGDVKEKSVMDYIFNYSGNVEIKNVIASCGCTSTKTSKKVDEDGTFHYEIKGKISVGNAPTNNNLVSYKTLIKKITVNYKDKAVPSIKLTLTGKVFKTEDDILKFKNLVKDESNI